MRELVEAYQLLSEIGNTKISPDEIKTYKARNTGEDLHNIVNITSDKVSYDSFQDHKPEHLHPDHNGITHEVAWTNNPKNKTDGKLTILNHALAMHNHYIENHTRPGDVMINTPTENKENSGKTTDTNKRASLYQKKYGFSAINKDAHPDNDYHGKQFGIVRQHPKDHPEEHKRGKNYLDPLHKPDFNKLHSSDTKKLSHHRLTQDHVDEEF